MLKRTTHLAATLAGQHEGEDIRMREERVARLLNDPEKLRELRQQRAELEHANVSRRPVPDLLALTYR